MVVKIAKERCWLSKDGKTLVKDGDPEADRLVAGVKGAAFDAEMFKNVENVEEFFEDINASGAPMKHAETTEEHHSKRGHKK